MPKNTRRFIFLHKKTRKNKKIKKYKLVSFASKTYEGDPVTDHSRQYEQLFENMTEIFI